MHKNDAAELFAILGDGDRVKMIKFLYTNNTLTAGQLFAIAGTSEEKFLSDSNVLRNADLLKLEKKDADLIYSINKEKVDELLSFLVTPCGCHK